MLERSILIPMLIVVVIGAPIIYHEMESRKGVDPVALEEPDNFDEWSGPSRIDRASQPQFNPKQSRQPNLQDGSRNLSSRTQTVPIEQRFLPAGFGTDISNFNPSSPAQSAGQPGMEPILRLSEISSHLPSPASSPNNYQVANPALSPEFGNLRHNEKNIGSQNGLFSMRQAHQPAIPFDQMIPDYGKAEIFVFPGDVHGPDLTAEPLEFVPIVDFREILRFDLTKLDVQRRWKRISTNPYDWKNGLSGMRTPLVTGTNSWDLHGSLTYFFDQHQQLQRVTFRGWTGDPQKLIHLLTSEFQFQQQPTSLAGFYLAKTRRKTTGGLLIKTPAVIDANNQLQQFAMVLEINRLDGNFELSEDFQALIDGSHPH
jgi:hypothetical protein